jgi:hypothetical protein
MIALQPMRVSRAAKKFSCWVARLPNVGHQTAVREDISLPSLIKEPIFTDLVSIGQ